MIRIERARRISRDGLALGALVAACALFAAGPASASGSRQPAAAPASGTPAIADRTGVFALRVERDAETGGWSLPKLAKEVSRDALEADFALNQSSDGLVTESLEGGGFAINLQGRFQSYSVARFGANGAVEFGCDDSPLSLYRWLVATPEPVDVFGRPTR